MIGVFERMRHHMEKETYLAAIQTNAALLAEGARLGLDAPVVGCPGWLVADVVGHIGFVHRTWAYYVRNRLQETVSDVPDEDLGALPGLDTWLERPSDARGSLLGLPEGVIAWGSQGARELEDALRGAAPDEPVWSWSDNHHVSHHLRMQAIETLVHRWDVQSAHGRTSPIDPELARDGIDQHFEVMLPARRGWTEPRAGSGETYHVHRTDGDGEWFVRFEPNGVEIRREHRKADVAIRGSAEDLWGRIPAERLDVVGDASLLERYRELVPPA